MESSDAWVRRFKRRLQDAGFKVTLIDPALAQKLKAKSRRSHLKALASGRSTPDKLQGKNSLFGGRGKLFRIVDYGGLDRFN